MPITDLTGYTWVGNSTIQYDSNFPTYTINYKAYYDNGVSYDVGTSLYMLTMSLPGGPGGHMGLPSDEPEPPVGLTFYGLCGDDLYSFSGALLATCIYEGGNTTTMTPTSASGNTLDYIEFTGGTDATNSTLIAWLEANGTLTAPQPSGHTITIDGTDYTIDDNTNLLVNSTGLYNSTTSTQVWTYSGDTKFLGFATTSGGAVVYDINDTITLTSDLTLYSVQQARMPLYVNNVRTDKYNNKVVNKIGDYFVARYEYSITTSVTNGTYSGSTSILAENGTATVTVTADSGYELPSSITVSGASYTYVGGVITLSNPTSDVTISVVCEAVVSGYSVTITYDSDQSGIWCNVYDGQNTSGTLLTKISGYYGEDIITCSSGYLYFEPTVPYKIFNITGHTNTTSSNPSVVSGNGSIAVSLIGMQQP